MPYKKLIILREDKPNINKMIGDVIDSLAMTTYEGVEVEKVGKTFVRVVVTDLDKVLEEELLTGVKRLRSPDLEDPFYQELLSTGIITTNNAALLSYVEVISA